MSRALSLEMMPRDVAEFLVEQRNQRFEHFLVARLQRTSNSLTGWECC
jgi:hypothetical protein